MNRIKRIYILFTKVDCNMNWKEKQTIKYTYWILISFFCFFGFTNLGASANEIVINNEGKPVLLMDDNTWKFIDTSGDDDKVVIEIIKGVDSHESYARKDDFDKFTHYDTYGGCKYTVEVKNRTQHPVKVETFHLQSNDREMFTGNFGFEYAFYIFAKVIEPQESHSTTENLIAGKNPLITEKPPTNPELQTLYLRSGCKAQVGKIFISKSNIDEDIVIFSTESGIAKTAVSSFVKGSPSGVYPLDERIRFNCSLLCS